MVGRHVCYLESEDGEKTLVLGNYSVGEKVTLGGNDCGCTFTEDVPEDMKIKKTIRIIYSLALGSYGRRMERKKQFST